MVEALAMIGGLTMSGIGLLFIVCVTEIIVIKLKG